MATTYTSTLRLTGKDETGPAFQSAAANAKKFSDAQSQSMRRMEADVASVGRGVRNLQGAFIGREVARLMGAAMREAADMHDTLNRIRIDAKLSTSQTEALGRALAKQAADAKVDVKQLAEGYEAYRRASGQSAEQAIKDLPKLAMLGKALRMDDNLADLGKFTGLLQRNFKLSREELGQTYDMMVESNIEAKNLISAYGAHQEKLGALGLTGADGVKQWISLIMAVHKKTGDWDQTIGIVNTSLDGMTKRTRTGPFDTNFIRQEMEKAITTGENMGSAFARIIGGMRQNFAVGEEGTKRYYRAIEDNFGPEARALIQGIEDGTIDLKDATNTLGNSAGAALRKGTEEAKSQKAELQNLGQEFRKLLGSIGQIGIAFNKGLGTGGDRTLLSVWAEDLSRLAGIIDHLGKGEFLKAGTAFREWGKANADLAAASKQKKPAPEKQEAEPTLGPAPENTFEDRFAGDRAGGAPAAAPPVAEPAPAQPQPSAAQAPPADKVLSSLWKGLTSGPAWLNKSANLAGKRASGGPIAAGRPYLVGERGPELMIPRGDGTIVPMGRDPTAMNRLGTGSAVRPDEMEVTSISNRAAQEQADAIARALKPLLGGGGGGGFGGGGGGFRGGRGASGSWGDGSGGGGGGAGAGGSGGASGSWDAGGSGGGSGGATGSWGGGGSTGGASGSWTGGGGGGAVGDAVGVGGAEGGEGGGGWSGDKGPGGNLVEQVQSKVAGTRRGPLDQRLVNALNYAATQSGLKVKVTSGGQRMPGAPGAKGSVRHDQGRAADFDVIDPKTGKVLGRNDPRRLSFIEAASRAGAGGAGFGYMSHDTAKLKMHMGLTGSKGVVGQGLGAYAGNPEERAAVARGIQQSKRFDLNAWLKGQQPAGGGAGGGFAGAGGTFGGAGATGGSPAVGSGPINRSKIAAELAANPTLKNKVLAIAANEQSTHPEGTLGVFETMFNRASSFKGRSLSKEARWTSEGGYYEDVKGQSRAWNTLRTNRADLERSLNKALSGSNITNYATDNASIGTAANKRKRGWRETARLGTGGGESFFQPHATESGAGHYAGWKKWKAEQEAYAARKGKGGGEKPAEPAPKKEAPAPAPEPKPEPKTEVAARASGGPVSAGEPYLVGEKGPEMVVPKQSGNVVPSTMMNAMKAASAVAGLAGFGAAGAALGGAAHGANTAAKGGGVKEALAGAIPGIGVLDMMKKDANQGHPIRTQLRGALGIEDPKEPAPWQQAKAERDELSKSIPIKFEHMPGETQFRRMSIRRQVDREVREAKFNTFADTGAA